MLDIVQLPLARRMWRISKFFQIPLNDERMQDLNMFDLEFYELSMIADDPKKLEQLQNRFYDDEFDDWLEEFEREQEEKERQKQLQSSQDDKSEHLDMPDEETIKWSEESRSSLDLPMEEYEISETTEISDWEEVN